MASLNRILLIGRVVDQPELRYTGSGVAVAKFSMAVDRKFSKNKETDFFNIVAWRRLGEICSEYLTKGKLISIEGRLQMNRYEGNDGVKRTSYEVVADDMQMLSRDDYAGGGGGGAKKASSGSSKGEEESSFASFPDEDEVGLEDVPF